MRRPDGVDGALWTVADATTRTAHAQLVEALSSKEILDKLAATYQNSSISSRSGHLFEGLLAHDFNRSAIAAHSTARAVVSEFAAGGSQSGPDDIRLMMGARLVGLGQAKLMGDTTAATSEISRAAYEGMGRYVPSEQLSSVESLLERRLTLNPDGLRYADYADARAHVSDRISYDAISGSGVTREDAYRAGERGGSVLDGHVAGSAASEILGGAATAAAMTALLGVASAAAGARSKDVSVVSAVSTSLGAIARRSAIQGGIAAAAGGIRMTSQYGPLPEVLGTGLVPYAMARASIDVATTGMQWARGEITPAEAARASALSVGRTSLVWAFTTAGQTVIPIPVVGGMVGAATAQVALCVMSSGYQMALAVAREERMAEAATVRLEAQAAEALILAGVMADACRRLAEAEESHYLRTLLPFFESALADTAAARVEESLSRLGAMTEHFGAAPVFSRTTEFEALMRNKDFVLNLDPN